MIQSTRMSDHRRCTTPFFNNSRIFLHPFTMLHHLFLNDTGRGSTVIIFKVSAHTHTCTTPPRFEYVTRPMRARQHILGYSTAPVSSIPGAAFCRRHTDTPFGSVGSLSRTETMADTGEAGEDEIQFLRTVSAFLSD
jgi:hypothetical protein